MEILGSLVGWAILNQEASYQLQCSIIDCHSVYCQMHREPTTLCSCACMCLGSTVSIEYMKGSLSDRSLYQSPSTTGSTWKLTSRFVMQWARRLLPDVSPKMFIQVSKKKEWFTWRDGVQHVKHMLPCITYRQVRGRGDIHIYQM